MNARNIPPPSAALDRKHTNKDSRKDGHGVFQEVQTPDSGSPTMFE